MITPRPPSLVTGSSCAMAKAHCVLIKNVPVRLMAITREKVSRSCACQRSLSRFLLTVRLPTTMPAQLTSTRSGPCAARAFCKAVVMESGSVTSASQNKAPCCCAISAPRGSRSNRLTLTPWARNIAQVACPNPDAPPVMMAAVVWSICIFNSLPHGL